MTATEDAGGALSALSNELANAVERAGRSLVTVDARRRLPATGVVWAPGVVVTADHVIEREEEITLTFADGQQARATLAGRDPGSDLAVLRCSAGSGQPAELAPVGSARVGHLVLALGRPGNGVMASFGVISALGGPWRTARGGRLERYVRADVTFYPGFSGGPLVDTQGRVVGINSSHLARGLEVAVPADLVNGIVPVLLSQGRVRRGYLGVTSQPVQVPVALRQRLGLQQETGLLLLGVEGGSPAEQGGLLIGDVLVRFGGQPITDPEALQAALGAAAIGAATPVTVVRGGELKTLTVTPGERS